MSPRRWAKVTLGQIATIERRVVDPGDIRPGTLYVGLENIASTGEISNQVTVHNGGILSTKFRFSDSHVLYGKLRPYLKKIARPGVSGICSTDILPIRAQAGLSRDYLFYFLRQPQIVKLATARCSGANLPRLSPKRLLEFEIPLPPLPEQKRIAVILDKAGEIRRKRRDSLRLADQFLRSVFLDMFGDPVMNPKGWPTESIGDLAPGKGELVDGPFGSALKPECYVPTGIRVIRNFNIRQGQFDGSEFKYVTQLKFDEIVRSEVKTGDILISTKGTVGNVCLMPDLPGASVLSASGTVRLRVSQEGWNSKFIVSQMTLPSYQRYIQGRQSGAVQQYFNLSSLRTLLLIKPPKERQCVFVEWVERVRKIKGRLAVFQDRADELFASIAQHAFRGELSVSNALSNHK